VYRCKACGQTFSPDEMNELIEHIVDAHQEVIMELVEEVEHATVAEYDKTDEGPTRWQDGSVPFLFW